MAHPEDLSKLLEGPRAWNAWRAEDPDHIPDLRDAELTISQRQFGPANGGPIDLSDADLQGIVLRNANLAEAAMTRANLVATDLVQARLEGANLSGADLTDAVLDYADLTGANLNGAILVGASLANVTGLVQEQILEAHGDASTALPAHLLPPESWFPSFESEMFDDYENQIDLSPLSNDPYEVLGVSRAATFDEIRGAFRTLVKKLHPDINPNDAQAQERFKRVSVAYRILGDPVKRDRFNRGELDQNGNVRPEFEAKKEFRRYALKYYVAAAASLILAIGILGVVWYSFWLQQLPGNQTAQSDDQLIGKQTERLASPEIASVEERTSSVGAEPQPAPEPSAVPPSQVEAVARAVQAANSLAPASGSADRERAEEQPSGTIDTLAEIRTAIADAPSVISESPATDTNDNPANESNSSNHQRTSTASEQDAAGSNIAELRDEAPAGAAQETQAGTDGISGRDNAGTTPELASLGNAGIPEGTETGASEPVDKALRDKNEKSATRSSDLVAGSSADEPASVFIPFWPAAHGMVLEHGPEVSIAKGSVSKIFRNRAEWQKLAQDELRRDRPLTDALQLPRTDELEFDFSEFELGEANAPDEPETGIFVFENAESQLLSGASDRTMDSEPLPLGTGASLERETGTLPGSQPY